jgi:hypothetical protein
MWQIIRKFVENKFFKASTIINANEQMNIPPAQLEEYVIKDLTSKIVNDIIDKNAYYLEKIQHPNPYSPIPDIEYVLHIAVDTDINEGYVRPDLRFTINGINFTDDEIKKALINTYPQKLI